MKMKAKLIADVSLRLANQLNSEVEEIKKPILQALSFSDQHELKSLIDPIPKLTQFVSDTTLNIDFEEPNYENPDEKKIDFL